MHDELRRYYALRSGEYDDIYLKPERQADLLRLHGLVREHLNARDVLEVACGTGYWTDVAAGTARSILATDANEEVIEVARRKDYPVDRVQFHLQDAWSLTEIEKGYDGGLAAFWLSHVPRQRTREWLVFFCTKFTHGACIVLIDNRYVEGSSTPLSREDTDGNTYQQRRLADRSCHEVLKNFFAADELRSVIPAGWEECALIELEYYWFLSIGRT